MTYKDLANRLSNNEIIVIKFTEYVDDLVQEDVPDSEMMARLVQVREDPESEEGLLVVIDLSGYEGHNRAVASHNWIDENGQPTKTWFDTPFYPKDGFVTIFVPGTMNTIVDLFDVEEHCPYCYGDAPLYSDDNGSHVYVEDTGHLVFTTGNDAVCVKIERCPKCGRVLG